MARVCASFFLRPVYIFFTSLSFFDDCNLLLSPLRIVHGAVIKIFCSFYDSAKHFGLVCGIGRYFDAVHYLLYSLERSDGVSSLLLGACFIATCDFWYPGLLSSCRSLISKFYCSTS